MRLSQVFVLAALALITACARPLTQNEVVFAKDLVGDTIEIEGIEVLAGAGLTPLPRDYPALRDPERRDRRRRGRAKGRGV